MEAKEANLNGKLNICNLLLSWGEDIHGNMVDEEVIEALEPQSNIKELTICGYRGKEMPIWMSDPSVLRNVIQIAFSECRNCFGLPALWNLPCLKTLSVSGGMDEMEYLFQNGNNNLSGGSVLTSTREFHSLEEMVILELPNLKGLLSEEEGEEEGRVQQQVLFPRLWELSILGCPQLASLPTLPAIESLDIDEISSVTLLASISKLKSLAVLHLCKNGDLVSFPEDMLQNLTLLVRLRVNSFTALKVLSDNISHVSPLIQLEIINCAQLECLSEGTVEQQQQLLFPCLGSMRIQKCPQLAWLPTLPALNHLVIEESSSVALLASISKLTSLTSLSLGWNDDVVSLPEEMLQNLTLLQSLMINNFIALEALPESMSSLSSLQNMVIIQCPKIVSLPENMSSLSSLQKISIGGCPKFVSLPDSIQTLTQLQTLNIRGCSPELVMQCEEGKGPAWYKIQHIPHVWIF